MSWLTITSGQKFLIDFWPGHRCSGVAAFPRRLSSRNAPPSSRARFVRVETPANACIGVRIGMKS
eukprot:6167526-Pyramimonas_sp.AAC.1